MPGKDVTDTQQSQEAIQSLIINPEDARLKNSEASQFHENFRQYAKVLYNLSKWQLLQTSELGALSSTFFFLFALFRDELRQRKGRVQNDLFQALIDATIDNTTLMHRILQSHPTLLDEPAPTGMVITSQLTFQRFSIGDETLLTIALKRKQVEILKELLPYYKKNPESTAKALEQWHVPEVSEEEYLGYKKRIMQLVYVIVQDPITDFQSENPNVATEQVLRAFMDELLPDNTKPIEDYPDPLQMAIAAFDILTCTLIRYVDISLIQYELFMVRVVGLLYTLLVPEHAKIVAEGLEGLKNNGRIKLGKKAHNLELQSGHPFYRSGKDDSKGQGFKFFCNYIGNPDINPRRGDVGDAVQTGTMTRLKIISSVKKSEATKLEKELKRDQNRQQNDSTSSCVIS